MHEQNIVESLLELAVSNAERAKAERIVTIHLTVGELSGIDDEAVRFYFGFLSKNTIAGDAAICFKHVQARFRCRQCGNEFTSDSIGFICPHCNDRQIDIIAGRELYLDSLEVE